MNPSRIWTWTWATLAALLLPGMALAQASPSAGVRDREAMTFDEIERGFHLAVGAGALFMFNPPANRPPRPFSPGQMVRLEVGYDFGERFSLALFGMASANRASADYIGESEGTASGDFAAIVPGLLARVNLVGFDDAQEVKRTWLYLRAGAGYAMFSPKPLIPRPDILVFGGPGVEYYTRLRHFSVGLEVTGAYWVGSSAFGIAVTPNLRYAF